jgi:hypothetical protein
MEIEIIGSHCYAFYVIGMKMKIIQRLYMIHYCLILFIEYDCNYSQ